MAMSTFAFGLGAATAASPAMPTTPTSVTAVQAGVGPDLQVNWVAATTGVPVTGFMIQLWQVSGTAGYVSDVTCLSTCTSVTFRSLTMGVTYLAAVYPMNANVAGPAGISPEVTMTTTCPVAACVTIDTPKSVGPANHADSGLLGALYPEGSDQKALTGLSTSVWRGAPGVSKGKFNWSSWNMAQSAGVQTDLVLSNLWAAETASATPWSNWSAYTSWVTDTVQTVVAEGHAPTYWEVYNEPGAPTYYSAANYATVTPALLLQQFLVTYQAIKAVIPGAQIVGPSLAMWRDRPAPPSQSYRGFDMVTFLNFAAANNLQLAAISWHFINDAVGNYPNENTLDAQNVIDEVNEARQLIAGLPALGSPKIFVNEFTIPERVGIPGWDVNYLSALTEAQVDSAGLSCWSNAVCNSPDLDGLLGPTGTTVTPDYWVRGVYAQMSGQMVQTTSTNDSVSALASMTGGGKMVALIGRGVGCVQNSLCASDWPSETLAAPEQVKVTITVPWSLGNVKVQMSDISGQNLTSGALPTVQSSTVSVKPAGLGSGTVTLSIPAFADGDAWAVTLNQGLAF